MHACLLLLCLHHAGLFPGHMTHMQWHSSVNSRSISLLKVSSYLYSYVHVSIYRCIQCLSLLDPRAWFTYKEGASKASSLLVIIYNYIIVYIPLSPALYCVCYSDDHSHKHRVLHMFRTLRMHSLMQVMLSHFLHEIATGSCWNITSKDEPTSSATTLSLVHKREWRLQRRALCRSETAEQRLRKRIARDRPTKLKVCCWDC